MSGKRKMIGFYITSGALLIVSLVAIIVSSYYNITLDISNVVKDYIWAQTIVSGGFFAFNGVEHLANKGK